MTHAATDGQAMFTIGHPRWPGLSKVSEEAGEVVQVIGKLMGTGGNPDHWDGSDLAVRLVEEMADMSAAIAYTMDHNGDVLDRVEFDRRVAAKRALFESWHEHAAAGREQEHDRQVAAKQAPFGAWRTPQRQS